VNALALLGARISRGPGDRDTRKKLRARPAPDEEYCARCWLSVAACCTVLYCTPIYACPVSLSICCRSKVSRTS
jgi:hypothetical protein